MPSAESKLQYDVLRAIGERFGAHPELVQDVTTMRNIFDSLQYLSAEATDVTYEDISISTSSHSISAQWAKPLNASKDHVILYAHGGGFITNSPSSHRKLVGHLAKASGCLALSVDYRLAPEHRFPSQLDDCVAVYQWLVKEKHFKPEHIATAGDSAGGNLAIAVALKLRTQGSALPAAIVAFSPWTDMTLSGESVRTNAQSDALMRGSKLELMVSPFVDDADRADPHIDVLHADLRGLPPAFLACGSLESLRDDTTRWAAKAREAGVDVLLEVCEGMQHVHVFMVGKAPEADRTIAEAGKWIKDKLKIY